MTHRIFRLERVTNTSPAVGTKARQPRGPVTRLVGWIKTEVFTRYELVEHAPAVAAGDALTKGDAADKGGAAQTAPQSEASATEASTTEASATAPDAAGRGAALSRRTSPYPQLRVVVVQDGQGSRQRSSRMVISGRMADVCAELDRLAA